jgi:D-methionine transport system ATP-binding protein
MGVIREICDRVAVIDNNHIVEAGSVIDVFSFPKSEAARKLFGYSGKSLPQDVDSLIRGNGFSRRIRVTFTGKSALKPVVSTLVREFGIDANILFGNIDYIQGAPLGELVLELTGEEASVVRAMEYIRAINLTYEVLKHAEQ